MIFDILRMNVVDFESRGTYFSLLHIMHKFKCIISLDSRVIPSLNSKEFVSYLIS